MPNGLIIIDKPAEWTSHDVVGKLRRVFSEKRIGHGGTLDPMATGVLPVFVGRATRAVEFFESSEKEYVAGLKLGVVTDTEDITGHVLEQNPVSVSSEQILAVLREFTGVQTQVPPMYSAVRVGGRRLYDMARKGEVVERLPRAIEILELEALTEPGVDMLLRVRCSKGTYIRTLCADIGRALGCGGCMSSLRRSRAGCFSLSQAVTMDNVLLAASHGQQLQLLRPVDLLFSDLPAVTVSPKDEQRCRNGASFPLPDGAPSGRFRCYSLSGEFLMLGENENGSARTVKSFFEVN